jgi:hypothetical protein
MFCHINKILALSFYTFTASVPAVDCIVSLMASPMLLSTLLLPMFLLLLDNACVPAFADVPAIASVSAVSLILLRLYFCWRPCSRLRHRICYPSSLVLLLPSFLGGVSLQLLTFPLHSKCPCRSELAVAGVPVLLCQLMTDGCCRKELF